MKSIFYTIFAHPLPDKIKKKYELFEFPLSLLSAPESLDD
jgi:hypothetical protein